MTTAAIVPIKAHSRRTPGKNFRMLGDKEMWRWPVDTLLEMVGDEIDAVWLTVCPDAVDRVMAQYRLDGRGGGYAPFVKLLNRDDDLCTDDATAHDFLKHAHEEIRADTYVFTHPCNPFISADVVAAAIRLFQFYEHDRSVVAVTPLQQKMWRQMVRPTEPESERYNAPNSIALFHNPLAMVPTQELPVVYIETCALYVFGGAQLEATGSHQGDNPILMPVDPLVAWDIDDEWEWTVADAIVKSGVVP